MSLEPANIHLQLRKSEIALMLMAFDAGVISLDSFNATAVTVLGMKADPVRHKDMMDALMKLQKELTRQVYEKKESQIIMAK